RPPSSSLSHNIATLIFFKTNMPSLFLIKSLMILFLLLIPISIVTAAARSLNPNPTPNYVTFMKPKKSHGGQSRTGTGRDVENCLPKGYRRSSAPSRYVNYQPLGSTICSTPRIVTTP
ncbi:Maintenance of mitochondrial morphology protein like, partial [Quillaja saponaria]